MSSNDDFLGTQKPGLYRFVRALVVVIARAYWRLTIEGAENVPAEGTFLLASVHRSNIDFGMMAAVTRRRMRIIAKDALWDFAPLGWLVAALGAFPVHRGRADREALRRCVVVLERGDPLMLFPEGTRGSGPLVGKLYEGTTYLANRVNVPIVPMAVGGSETIMPKGAKFPRPGRVYVVVGKPIYPPRDPAGGRAPRQAVHEMTEILHAEMQRLFDKAQAMSDAGKGRRVKGTEDS